LRLFAVTQFPAKQTADAADYHRLATNLAVDHGYIAPDGSPTAWRPPGYPFFLAGIYSIGGVNVFIACLIQVILGGLTALALMYLAMSVFDQKVAIVSGVIAALYPGFIYLPRLLLSENLAILLLLLSIIVAVRLMRFGESVALLERQGKDALENVGYAEKTGNAERRNYFPVILGFLLGLSVLARGANLITAALLLGLILLATWRVEGFAKASGRVFLVTLAMAFTLAPWVIRNYIVFHRLTPMTAQDGIALYASYWPPRVGSKLIWGNLPGEEDPAVAAAFKAGDEMAVSEYLKRETINRLKAEPLYFFRLWPAKLISLLAPFDWETFPHPTGASRSFNWGYVLILLPAALGALIFFRNPIRQKWALLVLPASVLIQALVFYGSPRFRLTAELIVIILAAAGISKLAKRSLFPT